MLKIDISNLVPKRGWVYLLGCVPGLLFECSVVLGNPQFAQIATERLRHIYSFNSYALFAIFLASCLVVGQVFFLASWFLEKIVEYLYGGIKYRLIRATLGSAWLYKKFGKIQGMPPKQTWVIRTLGRAIFWARTRGFVPELRAVIQCQRMAARELLINHYGITPDMGATQPIEFQWQVWVAITGTPPPSLREAVLGMRAILSAGLATLAAMYIVTALRNRYYVAMATTFTLAGAYQALDHAKFRVDPIKSGLLRLSSILYELSNSKDPESEAKQKLGLAITNEDADDE